MLHIATWNVERVPTARRRQHVIDVLAQRAHDVIALTESRIDMRPHASLILSGRSAPAPDRTDNERWVCIWTAEGIPARPLEVVEEPERSAAVLLEPPAEPPLLVFGTVLPWRADGRFGGRRGGPAFVASLNRQSADLHRLRTAFPTVRVCVLGDLNQELDANGPVGTAMGRVALTNFLEEHRLAALTAGSSDPLRRQGWRASIDHIIFDERSAASATAPIAWPGEFPLPKSPWPDHYGVELCLR